MTLYAECRPDPARTNIREMIAYHVEGELGCRVRRVAFDSGGARVTCYRSTTTVDQFMLQNRHLGEWKPLDRVYLGANVADRYPPAGENHGNQDSTETSRDILADIHAAKARGDEGYLYSEELSERIRKTIQPRSAAEAFQNNKDLAAASRALIRQRGRFIDATLGFLK